MTSTSANTTVEAPRLQQQPNITPGTASSALNTRPDSLAGRRRLHHIPTPNSKKEEQRWQLEHMAGAFRVFAKLGYADGGSGHISLRGEDSQK